MNTKLEIFPFNKGEFKDNYNKVNDKTYLDKYPVVYFINNDKEVYIGETTNFLNRTKTGGGYSMRYLNNSKRTLNIEIETHQKYL